MTSGPLDLFFLHRQCEPNYIPHENYINVQADHNVYIKRVLVQGSVFCLSTATENFFLKPIYGKKAQHVYLMI